MAIYKVNVARWHEKVPNWRHWFRIELAARDETTAKKEAQDIIDRFGRENVKFDLEKYPQTIERQEI